MLRDVKLLSKVRGEIKEAIDGVNRQQYYPSEFNPQNYNMKPGITIEDFETESQWVGGGVTVSENTTELKVGTKSVKIITTSGGSGNMTKTISRFFGNISRPIRLWVYCHGEPTTILNSLSIYLSSTTDFAKNMTLELTPQIVSNGWNCCSINLNSGGWTYTNESLGNLMLRMRFTFSAKSNQVLALSFDNMEIGYESSPRIIFTFDDGFDAVHDIAYPIMSAAGFKGVSYVIGNSIGGTGNMSHTKLTTLYNAGWDIGNHSQEHVDQSAMTLEQIEYQIQTCQNVLLAHGYTRSAKHYALPLGIYTPDIATALTASGVVTSRSSIGAIFYPEAFPVLHLPAKAILNTTTLSTAIGWIEETIAGGKTLILMFHNIASVASSEYVWATSNFQALVNYIKFKQVPVVTMSEWYAGLNL
jgi:peptidoglycan/xylan/chitin deacetylase (PgdA/CDA1 family)